MVTDDQGRFELTVTGCQLIRLSATRAGYRHFFDEDPSDGAVQTNAFRLISWSEVQYKTDSQRPAIFVFVKDGIREVSALPCRGGFHAYGKQWILNKRAWPKKPSLTDVVEKRPATNPN